MDMIDAIKAQFDGHRYYIEFDNLNELCRFNELYTLPKSDLRFAIQHVRDIMERNGTGVMFFDDNFNSSCWAAYSPGRNPEKFKPLEIYKNLTDIVRPYIAPKVSIDSWEELMR